jgi:hypothetical protein
MIGTFDPFLWRQNGSKGPIIDVYYDDDIDDG